MIQLSEAHWNTHAHHVAGGFGVARVATAHCGTDHCGALENFFLFYIAEGCPRLHNARGREVLAGFVPVRA